MLHASERSDAPLYFDHRTNIDTSHIDSIVQCSLPNRGICFVFSRLLSFGFRIRAFLGHSTTRYFDILTTAVIQNDDIAVLIHIKGNDDPDKADISYWVVEVEVDARSLSYISRFSLILFMRLI